MPQKLLRLPTEVQEKDIDALAWNLDWSLVRVRKASRSRRRVVVWEFNGTRIHHLQNPLGGGELRIFDDVHAVVQSTHAEIQAALLKQSQRN